MFKYMFLAILAVAAYFVFYFDVPKVIRRTKDRNRHELRPAWGYGSEECF